jgi:hypothetical protein
MTTRSTQLWAGLCSDAGPATFTVPANTRVIVKEIRFNSEANTPRWLGEITLPNTAVLARIVDHTMPDVYTVVVYPCWIVLNAGQVFRLRPLGGQGTDNAIISGAELDLP